MTAEADTIQAAFILEDIAETCDWLKSLLAEAFGGSMEVASAPTLKAARAWLSQLPPNPRGLLALVDLNVPDGSGIELIRELREKHPSVQVVVTTVYDDDHHLIHAIAAGAQGYLLKDREADELVRQLRGIDRGEAAISPAVARRILDQFRTHATFVAAREDSGERLTPRETDVLRLIGRGLTLAEAAGVLGLTASTVAGYVKAIYRKLGITSRAEAALEAQRRSLT